MKKTILITTAALGLVGLAAAQTTASAVLTQVGTNGGLNVYDIDLTNTGTTSIGTFWFAWVPGEDFMSALPSSISEPAGWSLGGITGGSAGDGYAIQWLGSLAAGNSVDGFTFDSSETLAELAANSPFFPTKPSTTSFVYQGAPFSGGSDQFVVQVGSTPEPADWFAIAPIAGLIWGQRRRLKASNNRGG
jgi:hypothetical protein